jgi:hypothetical protein
MTAMHTAGPWVCEPTDSEGPDYGVSIIAVDLGEDGLPLFSPTRGLVGAALPWPTEIDSGDMSRVEANANLMASAPALLEALEKAREQFLFYEQSHLAKYPPWDLEHLRKGVVNVPSGRDAYEKALVNAEFAAMCDAALSLARTGAAS